MFDPNQFESIAQKLFTALPGNLKKFEHEIQQEFKEILMSAFTHMDIVTREEFDIQVNVLARTRQKVETLQKQLDCLLKTK
jgi:BMFP domain-containing protein YqiC